MPAPSATADAPRAIEPTWGVSDAAIGWVIAESIATLLSGLLLAAAGLEQPIGQAALDVVGRVTGHHLTAPAIPLWMIAVQELFLWTGFLGVPLVVTRMKGNGLVHDLGLKVKAIDVPIGVVTGLVSQYGLVLVLSLPWLWLLGKHLSDLNDVADKLGAKASNRWQAVLLVVIVVIGAPVMEEIFFRGLLLRAIQRRWGTVAGVIGSAVVFGVTHFELLQLPALIGFGVVLGVLAVRTQRLGPGIFAHLTFNAATVFTLLYRAHLL